MNKRIYSLNLCAYIMLKTGINPVFYEDDDKKGIFYSTFMECEDVNNAIKEFNTKDCLVFLHEYLSIFKTIKEQIYTKRNNK